MGPTASGKSLVAEAIADRLGLQLVSADAFMVYRGFDIGTNKPTRNDYELIDILDPEEEFGVGEWIRRTCAVLEGLWGEGRGAVVVGGTGFYVRALFEEYSGMMPAPDPALRKRLEDRERAEGLGTLVDELLSQNPEAARTTDLENPVRVRRALERALSKGPKIEFKLPPFRQHKYSLGTDPTLLDAAISARVDAMFEQGWETEVEQLLASGLKTTAPAFRAIGYECVVDLIEGRIGRDEARNKIALATRQYAKRQRTWLRSEPRVKSVEASPLGEQGATHAVDSILFDLMSLGT